MILKLFSLRDTKVESYLTPIAMQTPGQLTRMLQDEMKKADTLIGQHPEDFELWEIGEFDTDTGKIKAHAEHKSVMQLKDLQT